MAKAFNYRFNFHTSGMGNLLQARHSLRSLGGTAWQSFNQMSRSASTAQRSFNSLYGTISKFALGAGLFTGFGLLAKNLVSTNAELQTNRLIFDSMMQDNKAEMPKMIDMLRDNAAELGFAESEIFKSARGLYSAFSAGGRKVDTSQMSELMKIVETLNVLDTENRGLSFTAFSVKEIAQGTGLGDFKSIINRLEVQLSKSTKEGITKALQSKDVTKATELLWKGLEEAKIPKSMLQKLMQEGFINQVLTKTSGQHKNSVVLNGENSIKAHSSQSFINYK